MTIDAHMRLRTGSASQGISQHQYIRGLDGLRAFAVLAVMLSHAMPDLARGGSAGVDIFFVLSGFLITGLLREEIRETGKVDLRRFYLRRLLRLSPALWLMIAGYGLACLVASLLGHGPGMRNVFLASVSAVTYVMNWIRAFNLGPEAGLGHTWSLSIEEQFYLVWPAILLAMSGSRRVSLFAGVVTLLAASLAWSMYLKASGADIMRVYNGFDTRAWELLAGCAIASFELRRLPAWTAKTIAVPTAFLAYAVFGPIDQIHYLFTWGLPGIVLAAAWLIVCIVLRDRNSGVLTWPAAVYLGRISYGLYLWHWPMTLALQGHAPPFVNFCLVLTASVILASVSYFVVERPVMRLRAKWALTTGLGAKEIVAKLGTA